MLAARVPTRHRSWRRVKPRAAADAGKMVGSAQLLPLFSAGGAVTCKTKKKHKSQQQAAPFHLGFFFICILQIRFSGLCFYSVSSRRQGRGHGPEGRHCWRREERLRVLLLPLGAVRPVVKEIGCCCWWPVCGLC
ncbi:hypothetical protein POPTR_011G160250v4 [Populus trichocarpa]|uniref:Uncharacterized protein n=3 Tax=Populus trichocarpa TaxID=3694 RepID=A0ACC0SBD2_POPTR|nr:hypothetical protein POPTR_011G160250v4 [Populus trichocarpa]KAI9386157.1 hypothetical protein POPTR_011G160250v4 [Populus trichocarpa]RQO98034.1 hypothetical protein POPTR_011G160250v4 [Populus trichocarpa]